MGCSGELGGVKEEKTEKRKRKRRNRLVSVISAPPHPRDHGLLGGNAGLGQGREDKKRKERGNGCEENGKI